MRLPCLSTVSLLLLALPVRMDDFTRSAWISPFLRQPLLLPLNHFYFIQGGQSMAKDERTAPYTDDREKPILSEVIDYDREIAPYPLSMIYSGIGSGKNTFAGHLMNGHKEYNIPKKTVLLITSRKAKVVETLNEDHIDISRIIGDGQNSFDDILMNAPLDASAYRRTVNLDQIFDTTIMQRSSAVTNAFIEKYHHHIYKPDDPATHLWNRFDVIIVDEVHSLVTDSTYQTAPYYVWSLVKETVWRIHQAMENEKKPMEEQDPDIFAPVCKNIILMTGTPEAVKSIERNNAVHLVDKQSKCRNVAPKHLHFIDRAQADKQIIEQLLAGKRLIYFTNKIIPVDTWAKLYGIPREKIAMQFSDKAKLDQLKKQSADATTSFNPETGQPETDYEKLMNVQAHLAKEKLIRSDIQFFATTSKNKEGININNKDIHHVYIESNCLTEIRQMAGRVREGAEHAYVIVDAPRHSQLDNPFDLDTAKMLCSFNLNWADKNRNRTRIHFADCMLAREMAHTPSSDPSKPHEYLNYLRSQNPYLEFNYFQRKFQVNKLRKLGIDFEEQEQKSFENAISDASEIKRQFGNAFPQTHLHLYCDKKMRAEIELEKFLQNSPEHIFPKSAIDQLCSDLDTIFNDAEKRSKRTSGKAELNRFLHDLGYHCQRAFNKKKSSGKYDFFTIKSYPPSAKPKKAA